MANATYNATNNNWVVTQNSTLAANTYLVYNNTGCGIRASIAHSNANVDTLDIELAPGESIAYSATQDGNVTVTGTPIHTASGATDVPAHKHRHEYDSTAGLDGTLSRLIFTVI